MTQSRTAKVIALSMGSGLTAVVGVVSSMVLARVLTKTEYATYRQTMLAYQFAAPLLMLSLPMALYYFLPTAEKRERGVLLDNIVLLAFMASLFSAFLLLGGNRLLAMRFSNPDLANSLQWLTFYPLLIMPASVISAVLVIKSRTTALAVYNVSSRFAMALLIIVSSLIWRNHLAPVISQVVWAAIMLPIALYMSFSAVSGGSLRLRPAIMVAMLKYSIPLGLATMLGTITLQLDKMIVSAMCPPEDFAVYANGAIEIPLIGMVTGAIATVILADMAVACRNNRPEDAMELFRKAATRSGMILLPVTVFLLIHARDFIILLYSDKYADSVVPFRIFLLILPVRIVYYGSALMALGKTRTVLWRSIGDLAINAILCYLLVNHFGYLGATAAIVLTLYLWTVPYNLYAIGKGFSCNPTAVVPFGHLAGLLAIAALAGAVSTLPFSLPALPRLPRFALSFALFALVYAPMAYRWHPEVRRAADPLLLRFRRLVPGLGWATS